ncbi:MAG: SRPBCC family protein, partial [Myxococcota bacterium]
SASPDVVWARWMDVESWPTWDTELTEATADAPLALDVTGSLVSGGRASPFTIVAFEAPFHYAYAVPLPAGRLVVDRRLLPLDDGGTRFTHTVTLEGFGGWMLGPVLGRRFRAALPQVMRSLATLASGSSTDPGAGTAALP